MELPGSAGARVLTVTFHGVRGSTPCADPRLERYGGNTSCVSLRGTGFDPIVLDLGTGLRSMGATWRPDEHFVGTALVTHLHWDHVQGLPFFTPVLRAGGHLTIHGPVQDGYPTLHAAFDTFMRPPFFPVRIGDLPGKVDFVDTPVGTFGLGPARVTAREIPHIGRTYGYRVDAGGASVAYLPDHQQPSDGSFGIAEEVLDLADGADLLIHDAQYVPAEFAKKADWGHCTIEYALWVAKRAKVRRLALFHHDPLRTDEQLDDLVVCARDQGRRWGIEVVAAAEGSTICLG